MKLSVVIPAHNEVDSITETIQRTVQELRQAGIDHEILVIDDASSDGTAAAVNAISASTSRTFAARARTFRPASGTPCAPASTCTPAMPWRS